ncbi:MAG: hypothetical protein ACRDYF_06710 [Acidimicrobiia bacterium]
MPVTANLDKILDKAYENSTLSEIVNAPVSAMAGVSDGDAEHLATAFSIKTIGDLGTNKYFKAAAALAALAD